MANSEKLEEYRKNSGKSKTYLAKKLKISRPYFYRCLKNPDLFTFSQVEILSKEMDIKSRKDKDDIFLP